MKTLLPFEAWASHLYMTTNTCFGAFATRVEAEECIAARRAETASINVWTHTWVKEKGVDALIDECRLLVKLVGEEVRAEVDIEWHEAVVTLWDKAFASSDKEDWSRLTRLVERAKGKNPTPKRLEAHLQIAEAIALRDAEAKIASKYEEVLEDRIKALEAERDLHRENYDRVLSHHRSVIQSIGSIITAATTLADAEGGIDPT